MISWTHRTSFKAHNGNHLRNSKGEILQPAIVCKFDEDTGWWGGRDVFFTMDSLGCSWTLKAYVCSGALDKFSLAVISVILLPHIFWTLIYLEALPK